MSDEWENGRDRSEAEILDPDTDFSTKLYAVYWLRSLGEKDLTLLRPRSIEALEALLKDSRFRDQRRSLFLFREAADTLASIVVHGRECDGLGALALAALTAVLGATGGHAHRVSAEALGALPSPICGPRMEDALPVDVPAWGWRQVLDAAGRSAPAPPRFLGRSLVAPVLPDRRLLVVKLAREADSPQSLLKEALWMEHLGSRRRDFPTRFNIPEAVPLGGGYVFRLSDLPTRVPSGLPVHPERFAIAFVAHREYFCYPNGWEGANLPPTEQFLEVMCRNAWLLGRLASLGMVHGAPVPLFHNRVQMHRRSDQGRYQWFRGGRLDRWLASCSYPNLGVTGIRDFEHLSSLQGFSRELYRHVGEHLLGLLLLAGSHFRNRNRQRVGLDPAGNPVDARDLFDPVALRRVVEGVFDGYHRGFVGRPFTGGLPMDLDRLTARMIEEMGVDRHMEEILRVADQQEMARDQFESFLAERGYTPEEARTVEKGTRDIVIHTGPHLGAFNDRISLPELIESVAAMSGLCIAGKHWNEVTGHQC